MNKELRDAEMERHCLHCDRRQDFEHGRYYHGERYHCKRNPGFRWEDIDQALECDDYIY